MRQKGKTAGSRSRAITSQAGTVRFFDREPESRRIAAALESMESLMMTGPADIGKTALILNVIRTLPRELAGKCLYVAGFKDLHDLLRNALKALRHADSPGLRQQLKAEGASSANFEIWLKGLPSSRLKGVLFRAVEGGDYRVILDHVPVLTPARAKIIKELFWMRDTPVYLFMRDDRKSRIAHFARFFYWSDRQCLTLGPLPVSSARKLMETCVEKFGLSRFNLEVFREEVLDLSGCVPGAIVKMCALAADPRYQFGSRIKTKLVHIDYLLGGSGRVPSVASRDR